MKVKLFCLLACLCCTYSIFAQENKDGLMLRIAHYTARIYPHQTTPIVPLLVWSHRFTPNWTLDTTLPSRCYIRYQYGQHHFIVGIALEYK